MRETINKSRSIFLYFTKFYFGSGIRMVRMNYHVAWYFMSHCLVICVLISLMNTVAWPLLSAVQFFYTPPNTTKLYIVYWFHSVRPSVHPSIRPASHVHSVAPTVLLGSISYLYILPSNLWRCVACKVSCKILIFGNFFKCVTLTLSYFDLGSEVNHKYG